MHFELRGRFQIPAARWWWTPVFQQLAPGRVEHGLERLEASLRRGLAQGRGAARAGAEKALG